MRLSDNGSGRREFFRSLLLAGGAALLATSCARKAGEPAIHTGKVLTRGEIVARAGSSATGKPIYAEVNRDWLAWCYADFRAWIGSGQFGVLQWDNRSQCTFFASAFEVYCQGKFFAHAFHSTMAAPGIAVGTIWYPTTGDDGHAVNLAVTANGRELFEPQTGNFFTLADAVYARAYFRKFD